MTRRIMPMSAGSRWILWSPVDRLSDRELEVFQSIGQGLTTRQIAGALGLSVRTIETHRENIKAKLNVRNSAELSRAAVQCVLESSSGDTASVPSRA
jgi:DNA-binding CsgD family transcriptional regulator